MPEATIGVIGTGTLSRRMINSLLDDQLEALGDLRLILPITKSLMTDEIEIVFDWADKADVPVEVVVDEGGAKMKSAKEFLDQAVISHSVKGSVAAKMVSLLGKAEGRLFVFWDDEDDEGYEAFEKADEAGLAAYDLTNGLERLSFGDEDEGEEESVEEEPEPKEEEEVAPAKPEGEGVNTRAEMMRMTVPDLKKMIAERGITLNRSGKGRIAKGAYVDAILQHDETGAAVFMQDGATATPISDDEVAQAADDDVPEDEEIVIPEEDESDVEIPSEDDEGTTIVPEPVTASASVGGGTFTINPSVPSTVWKNGVCGGCGGPVYTKQTDADDWPEVRWFHAENCPLA